MAAMMQQSMQPLLHQQTQQQQHQQHQQHQQQQKQQQQQQPAPQPQPQQLQPCTATLNGNPVGIGVIDTPAGENREFGHGLDTSLGFHRGGREEMERLEGTALAPRGQLDLHGGAEGVPP